MVVLIELFIPTEFKYHDQETANKQENVIKQNISM